MEKINRYKSNQYIGLKLQSVIDHLLESITYEQDVLKKISRYLEGMLVYISFDCRISCEEYSKLKSSIEGILKVISYKKVILKNKLNIIKKFAKSYNLDFNACQRTKRKQFKNDPLFSRW